MTLEFMSSFAQVNQGITYITGHANNISKQDTVHLILNGPFYSNLTVPEKSASQILTATSDEDGNFSFKIPSANAPFHVSLFLSGKRNMAGYLIGDGDICNYLIAAGDSIHIDFQGNTKSFTGKGAINFLIQNKLAEIENGPDGLKSDKYAYWDKDVVKWLHQKDSLLNRQLDILNSYKTKVSSPIYDIIRADLIGTNRAFIYLNIEATKPFFISGFKLDDSLKAICQEIKNRPKYFDSLNRATLSPRYIYYLYEKLKVEVRFDRIVNGQDVRSDENYFTIIKSQFKGILRDKLLAYWLLQLMAMNDLKLDDLSNALSAMETPAFIAIAENLKHSFAKGQPLSDFDFMDRNGKTVHLSDFKGKVLVIDMWFTGCTACVVVANGLKKIEPLFKENSEVVFISISVDKDKNTWLKSISKNPAGTYYIGPSTTYLYTAGTGYHNSFTNKYVPNDGYPSLLLIDKHGAIYSANPSHPVSEDLKEKLINEIHEALLLK